MVWPTAMSVIDVCLVYCCPAYHCLKCQSTDVVANDLSPPTGTYVDHQFSLIQGLVVALGIFSLLDRACFCVIFSVYGCILCLVHYLLLSVPEKIRPRNDLLCVEWDVKPY